jgi:predicted transcriptional regulator
MINNSKDILKMVKEHAKLKGLCFKDVCDIAGLGSSTVYQAIKVDTLRIDVAARLLNALDIKITICPKEETATR